MTSHTACSHPATAAARANCRRARVRVAEIATMPNVKSAPRRGELSDDDLLRRNRARFTDSSWPTDDDRAAFLTKVWCTTCHLLHEADDPCSGVARRVSTAALEHSTAPAPRPPMGSQDMLPTFANARALANDIPEGRYAVRHADGTVKFYKLDKPTEGRWAGYVFLKIQASEEFHPVKMAASQISVYSAIIDAGVRESSALYGHELGHCGVCGRTLTDPESISAGIGPKCAARLGW